jgi:endogenous inhibitor of DNA gyrase (YacG/DUF329 family)
LPRVLITCPETGKQVYTGTRYNWQTFDSAKIGERTVRCPYCGEEHVWRREDVDIDEDGGG